MSELGNYDGWKLRTPEDDGADHSSENDPDFCYECQNHADDCECDLDGPEDDECDRGCVLGADCLVADPFHASAECFDVEIAKQFMGEGE